MILPFSTQINGKLTYFPEKILSGLYDNKIITDEEIQDRMALRVIVRYGKFFEINFDESRLHRPKLHTIREDKNDRWKPGVMIDFFINARQKNMFRFAPRIPVVSVQKIEIKWYLEFLDLTPSRLAPEQYNYIDIAVDGNILEIKEVEILAKNDGFETVEDFFSFFNKDFTGKIIHWTDLKY